MITDLISRSNEAVSVALNPPQHHHPYHHLHHHQDHHMIEASNASSPPPNSIISGSQSNNGVEDMMIGDNSQAGSVKVEQQSVYSPQSVKSPVKSHHHTDDSDTSNNSFDTDQSSD